MQGPSIFKHIRDIVLLPFTVSIVIPFLIYKKTATLFGENPFHKPAGILLFITGLALFSWTVYLFRSFGKGTLAPWTPTQKLVVRGPYKYCRNPMITGVFFILIGETLFFNSLNIFIEVVIFFLINTVYFILKEEPDLKKRFGAEYDTYKRNVPRWIPRFRPYDQMAKDWKSNPNSGN